MQSLVKIKGTNFRHPVYKTKFERSNLKINKQYREHLDIYVGFVTL